MRWHRYGGHAPLPGTHGRGAHELSSGVAANPTAYRPEADIKVTTYAWLREGTFAGRPRLK